MEQEEKDIELIEAYHQGTLSEDEIAAFEKRRAEDEDFDRKVEDYVHIMSEIRTFGERDFMKKLHSWEKDIAGEKEAKVIPLKTILSIAAAIIIILIPIGYLLMSDQTQQGPQELYTAYFKPYEDVISERSESSGLLEQGLSAYNQENYRQAITYLEGFVKENPENNGSKTYLGIAYLASNEPEKAESILKDVTQNASGLFKEVSEWYLALAYLDLNQKNRAKDQFNNITSQPDHMYYSKAKELLQKID
ncbi:hypothetical protein C900_03216 [Fulvivirga imtechensis AK7]|uniref:Uncharacterized protein n=1 Tax=Fulvivirga imtechensis AK7 TaxID=1237149 RepID=L8JRV6_9BACT|nr:tetratricopeptide repeat protein [Fulvivirga imtechensis]ELR70933.1 hypothetical protein C900_03216 [Fulvivirga imtechensis AK7]